MNVNIRNETKKQKQKKPPETISIILAIIFQEREYRHAAATFKLQLGIGHAFS